MSAKALNLIPLAVKQLVRHRMRTLLTIGGISSGMFLFAIVENMQRTVVPASL